MKIRKARDLLLALLALMLLSAVPTAGAGEESVQARIPVSAVGADCTAVLADKSGNVLQSLPLKAGETASFTVQCEGLWKHPFTIALAEQDTETTIYDKTKYDVTVELFLNDAGDVIYTVTADPLGTLGDNGKPEKLEFRNSYTPLPCTGDPPVKKQVKGNPPKKGTFTFVMKAGDSSFPMPEGSRDGTKVTTIQGAGDVEFGSFTFTKAGTYDYTITERNTNEAGYTYDTTIYTLRFHVTENQGQLSTTYAIFRNGKEDPGAKAMIFVNSYNDGAQPAKTGDFSNTALWLGLSAVSLAALALIAILLVRQRRR